MLRARVSRLRLLKWLGVLIVLLYQRSVYKQTKNRHETGSNLRLGTRLTVLSKRLERKRCCDATPDVA